MADELWRECANWLIRCQVIPRDHRVTWVNAQVIDLANTLRDGVLLCHLLNNLVPGCVDLKEISLRPQMSQFLCRKNISAFLQTCQSIFELKATDLFEPYMLFDCTDFVQVLHTLSKLSNCPRVQSCGIRGFAAFAQTNNHNYYNDDIYRNLEDLANASAIAVDDGHYDRLFCPQSRVRTREEDVYEDLCYVKFKMNESTAFLEPPVEKRDYCIKELVETEKNYIEALNMIIRHFMVPLKTVIRSEDRKVIFRNIKDLAEIHTNFHDDLVKACTGMGGRLSQCFLTWKDKFIVYGDYCSNLPHAQELVDDLCTKNDMINQNITTCQMEANEGKFKLRDLLSVPMQRVLKYHLLLKELIRNTSETHEDFPGLKKSLDSMLDLSQYINEVKRDNETLQIIHDIQASITCLNMPEGIELKDYGRLLKDGELKIRSHNDNNRLKSRYVFVFDKVMLMCKTTRIVDKLLGGEQYSYKEALVLDDYKTEDIASTRSSGRDKWSFNWFLVHREQKVAYTMYAKTEEMKRKWIEAFQKAAENVKPGDASHTDHQLEMFTFDQPRHCDSCERLLRGVFYQGYQCATCKIAVHKDCISSVRSCGAPSLPPRPGGVHEVEVTNDSNAVTKRPPISCCVAKRTHHSSQAGYLSFELGDTIHILKKLSSVKWEGRLDRTAQEGWFPSEFVEEQQNPHFPSKRNSYELPPIFTVPPVPPLVSPSPHQQYVNLNLDEYLWYAGRMGKDAATTKLEKLPEGTFLVRISERQNGLYAISMKHENKVKHMRVQTESSFHGQSLFYLSESKYFKSLVELVKWYQENTLADSFTGLNVVLGSPYKQVAHGTVPLGYALVNYDFPASAANMLSLAKGERVAILCKRGGDKGWWKGQLGDKVGFFPMLYVTEESK